MSRELQSTLSADQLHAIFELATRGAGGSFDQPVMCELFVLGMIEVRNEDRRVGLTPSGMAVYTELRRSGNV